ncbi:hypothetical protein A2U01_0003548, partial [Trifolium medium]|nr:hypothetical protein [Trifolium medium]
GAGAVGVSYLGRANKSNSSVADEEQRRRKKMITRVVITATTTAKAITMKMRDHLGKV